ncbi:Cell division protein FtsI [Peptidoglycan synthetase] [Pseudonocardia sp. Ae168_Ps1]|nr:Cell division protein FtsI [Peptidoglycan synthetase] [Pseudonocardia sp. Ae150A_Ps1]OLL79142.1 Cell division protein FtsI [Peptidoglycan synthetase] [Pseudonocardia sp. Ae168_Ps1]OLL86721.1 Cell division protein FtsI [Peptidoglycan synthetase] [Pseudonocardia sp. Ae263_Ps1]OLL93234.1 Cell division protein FtsI [Peptidoglycan synthetase] [Pseudonocardia sp. Ae356_Ps1]
MADADQEAEARGHRDHELRGVHRPDDGARRGLAGAQQRGGRDRAPAAATGGVDEPGDQAERRQELRPVRRPACGGDLRRPHREPQQDVDAQREQDAGHVRRRVLGGQRRQGRRAEEGADRAGHAQLQDELPVHVAEAPVRGAGRQRRPHLGEVDRGTCGGRVDAGHEQEAGGGDAVGHAQGAVDELGEQSDDGEHDEGAHDDAWSLSGGGAGRSGTGAQSRRTRPVDGRSGPAGPAVVSGQRRDQQPRQNSSKASSRRDGQNRSRCATRCRDAAGCEADAGVGSARRSVTPPS